MSRSIRTKDICNHSDIQAAVTAIHKFLQIFPDVLFQQRTRQLKMIFWHSVTTLHKLAEHFSTIAQRWRTKCTQCSVISAMV